MSSVIALGNVVLILGLAQVVHWRLQKTTRAPFREWIATSQAWGGWAIFAATGIYILTLLAVEGLR